MAASCIYHLKCKSLSLYSVQKSFYSPAHSVVTLPPPLSLPLPLSSLCPPLSLSLSLSYFSFSAAGLKYEIDWLLFKGLTEVQPVWDSFSLSCLTPHVCSRCSDVPYLIVQTSQQICTVPSNFKVFFSWRDEIKFVTNFQTIWRYSNNQDLINTFFRIY